jgi:hypothetical protein
MTLMSSPAFAWGTAAHRYIMKRALDLLPVEIQPFFNHFQDEIVLRAVDPDLWRVAGFDEDSNHFLDLGVAEYGADPFTALPRDYTAAVQRFGVVTLKRNGLLPWREAEMFGQLRRAFEGIAKHEPYAPGDIVLFAAAASHYVQDAHQPLHATNNFDGQLSGQRGVHARFETELFERFASRLQIAPVASAPITNPRDALFDVLIDSNRRVAAILEADRNAVNGKDVYDDDYFEKFFTGVKPLLERQLGESIAKTAALITGAWMEAGKPALVTTMTRAPEKVRRP